MVDNSSPGWGVVWGCARGIGRSIALNLAQSYPLLLLDVSPDGECVAEEIRKAKSLAEFQAVDFSSDEEVKRVLEKHAAVKPLAGGIYVAGRRSKDTFETISREVWEKTFNTTLWGAFFAAQQLFPKLSGDNKFFVTISSVTAVVVGEENIAYHCAKAALEQLTRCLALAGGAHGIRVNSVRPGFIVHPEHLEKFSSAENKNYRDRAITCHPMKEIGHVNDVAHAVRFLCDPRTRFITGQVLPVDGGFSFQDQFAVLMRVTK